MIRGAVEPPGCWLDASAVLVRHYLGYCFDAAAKDGILNRIPRTGSQLIEDMEANDGDLLGMFRWVGENEEDLRERFLARFGNEVEDDTRERFLEETSSDRLRNHVYQVAKEFDRTRRDFEN
ncbi:MAG: hypothetical protein GY856_03090, partial [bacterium]|nr:hypothetical protein [bacterium]